MWYQTNNALKANEYDHERYPIGPFVEPKAVSGAQIAEAISTIERAPRTLRQAVKALTDAELDTPYRVGGWTVRQVVHHLADSHINAYIRFKLSVTEDAPTVKTYEEARWAELSDAKHCPVEISLNLLDALHHRWVMFLRSMSEAEFKRTYIHPVLGELTLAKVVCLYAWHGEHHIAHVLQMKH